MKEAPPKKRRISLARSPVRARAAIVKGQDSGRFTDFYHAVLTGNWLVFILQLGVLFVAVNVIFALLYLADAGGIANAAPGSFTDAFFFSVQTLGAGGGDMAPKDFYTDVLVAVESFFGILTIAVFAGLMFARFSRPLSRVIFSKTAVVAPFDGVPTLMFRAANQRGNSILDASVTVSLARQYTTQEGVEMRRFHELKPSKCSSNPLFVLKAGRCCTPSTRTARFTACRRKRWRRKKWKSWSCSRAWMRPSPTISSPATPIGMTKSSGKSALWM